MRISTALFTFSVLCFSLFPSLAIAKMTMEEYNACQKRALDQVEADKRACARTALTSKRARKSCIRKAEKKFCDASAICWIGIGAPKPPCFYSM
jgi:hypothetical protein